MPCWHRHKRQDSCLQKITQYIHIIIICMLVSMVSSALSGAFIHQDSQISILRLLCSMQSVLWLASQQQTCLHCVVFERDHAWLWCRQFTWVQEPDARLGLVAVQLGQAEEAKQLFTAAARFDLLNKLHQVGSLCVSCMASTCCYTDSQCMQLAWSS